MTKVDDTHQNSKVYFTQGADTLAVDSDGSVNCYGTLTMQSGANIALTGTLTPAAAASFDFYSSGTLTGEQMRTYLYTNNLIQTIAASAGKLSVVNLPSGGTVFLSASIGCSNMSAWLTSCLAGAKLKVVFRRNGMAGESVGSVYISLSGVSLVGLSGQDLSSISITNSDGSAGYIDFIAVSDDEWAVVERIQTKIAERPSA